jgi:hypothetical protein
MMQAKDAIRLTLDNSDMILGRYVEDLSDADLMQRPAEGMNHLAWQLGHLISAERSFVESARPGSCPALPEGFEQAHSKETIGSDDPKKFRTKDEYVRLWKAQRAATKAALNALPDDQLDAPGPEQFRSFMPTVGAIFIMAGFHALLHVGQFVLVRR